MGNGASNEKRPKESRDDGPADADVVSHLAAAAERCDLAAIETLLLSHRSRDPSLALALRLAIRSGDCETVELLAAHERWRGSTTAIDDRGRTALHLAAMSPHDGVASAVLFWSSDDALRAKDDDGNTPLHLAAERGRVAAVEALLARGADVGDTNRARQTPAALAVAGGHSQCVECLRGADIERIVAVWDVFFERAAKLAVPTAWVECWDPTWDRIYYHDDISGQSTWDRPLGFRGDGCCGWIKCWDDVHDRPYFVSPDGEARWMLPDALVDALREAAYTEWLHITDGEVSYWVHVSTGDSSWLRPTVRCWDENANAEYYLDLPSSETSWTLDHNGELLLADWILCVEESQVPYYWNERTGESSWDMPATDA